MADFSAELTSLHPSFTLVGEAAATFVGLLFIAVTWNPYILGPQADPRFLLIGVNAFRDLSFILTVSLIWYVLMTARKTESPASSEPIPMNTGNSEPRARNH